MDLDLVRQRAEKLLNELDREFYLTGSGQKDQVDIGEIYEKYSDLADRKLLDEVREMLEAAKGEERKRLSYLYEFLVLNYLGHSTRKRDEEFLNREASLKVKTPEGEEVSFRYAEVLLLNEDVRDRRDAIDSAREKALAEELNPILEARFRELNDSMRELGFSNCVELVESLSGIDLVPLRDRLGGFLAETEELYHRNLKEYLLSKDIPLDDAKRHDLRYLMRGRGFDSYFSGDRLIEITKRYLSAMGIDMYAGGNVRYDLEEREKKSPRAFCSPIRVPDEVVLVIMPKGGAEDYKTFLHELGHALHYGHVDRELPFEFKYLGDNSVTEAFAMLFDHLPLNPAWVRELVAPDIPDEYIRHSWFTQLAMLRRYSAKLDYELALHGDGSLEGKAPLYSEKLSSALHVKYPETSYLYDVDDFFYCARYLRAWILESHLSSYLEENYGEKWFLNEDAGRFLVGLWRLGQKLDAAEIAGELGRELYDLGPMIERIRRYLP